MENITKIESEQKCKFSNVQGFQCENSNNGLEKVIHIIKKVWKR